MEKKILKILLIIFDLKSDYIKVILSLFYVVQVGLSITTLNAADSNNYSSRFNQNWIVWIQSFLFLIW